MGHVKLAAEYFAKPDSAEVEDHRKIGCDNRDKSLSDAPFIGECLDIISSYDPALEPSLWFVISFRTLAMVHDSPMNPEGDLYVFCDV
jgi:hypothetical protein